MRMAIMLLGDSCCTRYVHRGSRRPVQLQKKVNQLALVTCWGVLQKTRIKKSRIIEQAWLELVCSAHPGLIGCTFGEPG